MPRARRRFIRATSGTPETQTLLRRYRAGEAGIDGYAEDYACLIFGPLELFQAAGDPAWLAWARELQARAGRAVLGRGRRRLVQHDRRDPSVLLRLKEDYDGAEPAAGSVAVLNLIELVHLEPDEAASQRIAARSAGSGRASTPGARRALHGHEPGRLASRPDPDRGRSARPIATTRARSTA